MLHRSSVSPAAEPKTLQIGTRNQLLLVARCTTFRRLLALKLSTWGFQVVDVATSAEALLLPNKDLVRLLVADINGHSGDARLVQEFAAMGITSVILLRLGGEVERLKQFLLKAKTIIVYKPVRDDELFNAVLATLDQQSGGAGEHLYLIFYFRGRLKFILFLFLFFLINNF